MESRADLISRKNELEAKLAKMTIKKHGDVKWAPGVTDSFHSESYEYKEYTNPTEAKYLIREIEDLQQKIDNYAQLAQAEREREEFLRESRIKKYEYVAGNETKKTEDPAMAARYNAQQRYFGKNKMQKAWYNITGQKKKFEKLWREAAKVAGTKQQEETTEKLNGMFR